MKSLRMLIAAIFTLITLLSMAQTTPKISDEDLKKYAQTMDSVKVMQETLQQIITENVQNNKVMTVARYNELFKITTDSTKLNAANATTEEKAFLQEVADLRVYNNARINTTFQGLVKEYVGVKTFNTIKKSLETDTELKSRLDNISQQETSRQSTSNKG